MSCTVVAPLRLAITALLVGSIAAFPSPAASSAVDETSDERPAPYVVRVYYVDAERIAALDGFDLFEFNDRDAGYVLVGVHSADERAALDRLGFRVERDEPQSAALRPAVPPATRQAGIPGYPCYRTVEETYATADLLTQTHPQLASWQTIGQSWEKQNGGEGYDLQVLRLTQAAVAGPKPKLFITASIHAREYTPAELTTRFAELLVSGYGVDADISWLLDWHEIHLMLQANPDGRKQAEGGASWRKNTNEAYCGPTSSTRGADLNRNFEHEWACCGGSSGSECSLTYRGPSAASEPEVAAIQAYLRQEFPDQRGENPFDPAPADATGIYLDIHSFSELVLWPWGYGPPTTNDPAFRALGRKLAFFNGYTPQRSVDLYTTDGTTLDFGYGELGVASLVFELGTAFFQSCAVFESTVLPDNLDALLYAAKIARTPYITPSGPDVLGLTLDDASVEAGTLVTLDAIVDDTRYNQSNGFQPSDAIKRFEYYIDTPPWVSGAVVSTAAPVDGSFDSSVEVAQASIDTGSLSVGRHTIFTRAFDVAGNAGAVSAVFLDIVDVSADDDADGVPNGSDCAPADAATWDVPTPADGLRLEGSGMLAWQPPVAPGGTAPSYDVLRADGLAGLGSAACVSSGVAQSPALDGSAPAPGGLYVYLVRAFNDCGSAIGASSSGQPRSVPDCP